MTKPATVTKAQIKRAILAAQEAGLRIKTINPVDGTLVVDDDQISITGPSELANDDPWADD